MKSPWLSVLVPTGFGKLFAASGSRLVLQVMSMANSKAASPRPIMRRSGIVLEYANATFPFQGGELPSTAGGVLSLKQPDRQGG